MMAKSTRKNSSHSIESGDAFAVPLSDGRYSVCRVIKDYADEQDMPLLHGWVLVASSAWIGSTVPVPDTEDLRVILRLSHHNNQGDLFVLWVKGRPPKEYARIGKIFPSAAEQEMKCYSLSSWASFASQPLYQWRWDHEREAVLAEDLIKGVEKAKLREAAAKERVTYLAAVTLEELFMGERFKDWSRLVRRAPLAASRELFRATIQRLIDLGTNSPMKDREEVIRDCVIGFNRLDEQFGFIETEEREDIFRELEALAHAAGFRTNDLLTTLYHEMNRLRNW